MNFFKLLIIALLVILPSSRIVAEQPYKELNIKTEYGNFKASFFPADGKAAVIFVPGAKFDKEQYHFISHRLQKINIASISFDDIAGPAIIAAIEYLQHKDFTQISLIGGSRGGGVVLKLPIHPLIPKDAVKPIRKMILLAPYGGDCPQSDEINKLFIIGENDGLSLENTKRLYDECQEPKRLFTLPGTAYHAQQLFDSEHRESVANEMIKFISTKEVISQRIPPQLID